jgi:hypothetical protein
MLWLTGLNAIDHTTLWRFWDKNKGCMKPLFRQTVRVAAGMGLVSMIFHAIDGTKLRPASSSRAALHAKDLEKLLLEVDALLEDMEREIAQDRDQATEQGLPQELTDARARRKEIARQLQSLNAQGKEHLLPAEPEVGMIKSGAKTDFNYNAQAVADSASGILVAEDVVTDVLDTAALAPMLEQVEQNLKGVEGANETGRADDTAADAGYTSQVEIEKVHQAGWNLTVPIGNRGEMHNALHSHHFAHDTDADCLICPVTGQQLPFARIAKHKDRPEGRIYRCPITKTCPLRTACTTNQRGREIEINYTRPSVLQQVQKHTDGRMGEAMRRRLGLIEPVFGWIKEQLGLRRFTVRGLQNVRAQWSLTCITYNLSKMLRHWQRQFAPGGASSQTPCSWKPARLSPAKPRRLSHPPFFSKLPPRLPA